MRNENMKKPSNTRAMSALIEKAKTNDTVVPILNASIRLNLIFGTIVVILTASNIAAMYAYAFKPVEREYIIQDENGRIISNLLTLKDPLTNEVGVSARVDECLRKTFNLDFVNYKTQLMATEPCYTNQGWREMRRNMDNQGLIRDLTASYSVGNLGSIDPVRVTKADIMLFGRKSMVVKGSYAYKLSNGQPGKGVRGLNYRMDIEAIVVEVPLTENSHGFAINRMMVRINNA